LETLIGCDRLAACGQATWSPRVSRRRTDPPRHPPASAGVVPAETRRQPRYKTARYGFELAEADRSLPSVGGATAAGRATSAMTTQSSTWRGRAPRKAGLGTPSGRVPMGSPAWGPRAR